MKLYKVTNHGEYFMCLPSFDLQADEKCRTCPNRGHLQKTKPEYGSRMEVVFERIDNVGNGCFPAFSPVAVSSVFDYHYLSPFPTDKV